MSHYYIESRVIKPRKPHQCRICGEIIGKGESCYSYRGIESGEGFYTIYFHHECFDYANKFIRNDEWEFLPGSITRQDVLEELNYENS